VSHRAQHWCEVVRAPNGVAKSVLAQLCYEARVPHGEPADSEPVCWPSVSRLVDVTQWSERAVRKALAELEASGLIRREARRASTGRSQSSFYHVMIPRDWAREGVSKPVEKSPDVRCVDTANQGGRVHHVQGEGAPRAPYEGAPRAPLEQSIQKNRTRDGQASPSARSPSPASGRADPHPKPDGKAGTVSTQKMAIPVDPAAAQRWANLQRAVLSRKVEGLFAAWINAATVKAVRICDASGTGVIEVGTAFHANRLRAESALAGLLDQQGWRVTVSGAGG
jgi:hypothetical protein